MNREEDDGAPFKLLAVRIDARVTFFYLLLHTSGNDYDGRVTFFCFFLAFLFSTSAQTRTLSITASNHICFSPVICAGLERFRSISWKTTVPRVCDVCNLNMGRVLDANVVLTIARNDSRDQAFLTSYSK